MKTSQKLREVFENIRPHINGHRTIINQFLESINEVEEMEALSQHDVIKSVCSCGSRLVKTNNGYYCGNVKCSVSYQTVL